MIRPRIAGTRDEVRKFGLLFAAIFLLLAGYLGYTGGSSWSWFLVGAAFFLFTGLAADRILRPIYIGWMKFAFVLGWINTRLILGVFFYLIVTPMGMVMRLIRRDVLQRTFDRPARSYWKLRERKPVEAARYERLF